MNNVTGRRTRKASAMKARFVVGCHSPVRGVFESELDTSEGASAARLSWRPPELLARHSSLTSDSGVR